jgi:asparagine synthase (glutamine-hydrolysing)
VADFIGSVHHQILVTPDELIAELEHCVYQIETYDTTTIRASTPMLLMTRWITTHTDVKVIMSGEGSDEASGSYMYFHNAPSTDAFHDETIRLLKELPFFDV